VTNLRIFWALINCVMDLPSDDAEATHWCINHGLISMGSNANDSTKGDDLTVTGSRLFFDTINYFRNHLSDFHATGQLRLAASKEGTSSNATEEDRQVNDTDKQARRGKAKQVKDYAQRYGR